VVDLRRAIFGGERNVFDQVVAVFIKEQAGGEVYQELACFAFEPGSFDDTRCYCRGYQVPESRIQRLEHRGEIHFGATPLNHQKVVTFPV